MARKHLTPDVDHARWLAPSNRGQSALDAMLDAPVFAPRSDITTDTVIQALRHISASAGAGAAPWRVLAAVATDDPHTPQQHLCARLAADLRAGSSLSDALVSQGAPMTPAALTVIEHGERHGRLAQALQDAVEHLAEQQDTRRALRRALTYPLVGAVAVGSLISALAFAATPILSALSDLEAVPGWTRAILNIARLAPLLVIPALIATAVFRTALRVGPAAHAARAQLTRWAMRTPGYRSVVHHRSHARIARTTAQLLGLGLPLATALPAAATAAEHPAYTDAVQRANDLVGSGIPLPEALSTEDILRGRLTDAARMAEVTGDLASQMLTAARDCAQEADMALEALTDIVEPVTATLLGAVLVGWLCLVLIPVLNAA